MKIINYKKGVLEIQDNKKSESSVKIIKSSEDKIDLVFNIIMKLSLQRTENG